MAHPLPSVQAPGPIKFGTDGWRGVIGADFTFDRLYKAAQAAAQVLEEVYGPTTGSKQVIVGHDRRFLSEEFAQVVAMAVRAVGLEPTIGDTFAPTPAFSWAAHEQKALGALVITASHNPGSYSGLKIKGAFGGSVPGEVTSRVEAVLAAMGEPIAPPAATPVPTFNPWTNYCAALKAKVDVPAIQAAVTSGQLTIFVDAMHGAAATGLGQILGVTVHELNSDRDPLFGGGAPEPLPKYIGGLMEALKAFGEANPGKLALGLVFDGDADRIGAVDSQGNFLSSQILIPILIEHLSQRRGLTGEVIKTVSGSDLMPKVAALFGLSVHETAVGYKYIADRMLTTPVLIGGEESGGIGYGSHIPERDALLAALYVLEAVVQSNTGLAGLYQSLQERTGFFASYDRIDLPLASMAVRDRILADLQAAPPGTIAAQSVTETITTDGFKFRLADGRWLMIRFSGTEPVLRLYCEAPNDAAVQETLLWAKTWAEKF